MFELDNPKKHYEKVRKLIDKQFGKGSSEKILSGLSYVTGEESPKDAAKWAIKLNKTLEDKIDATTLIEIRENCACVITNKYSAYNKKYFKDLREQFENESDYLQAVAKFLSGRPRIGKYVEYRNGKIITKYGENRECGCFVVRGGWEKPPSKSWCYCCQGSLKSVYRFILPNKKCFMGIIETLATGGTDCIFETWFE